MDKLYCSNELFLCPRLKYVDITFECSPLPLHLFCAATLFSKILSIINLISFKFDVCLSG